MSQDHSHLHPNHPKIAKRLKRAQGHLRHVIDMLDQAEPCHDVAQQLFAVERAIANAKRSLIQDHIDHCLEAALHRSNEEVGDDLRAGLEDFKAITKYL
ncbi:MAG: metal-sensing transcriptional repressor [Cohaesibacter sp.]|nr:metal-sensing transcriptional repressor [Cohaesibacter sp.]MCV6600791.1 metal-sensing transcriptional repressor [Cohaesibacter sp.]